MAHTVYVQFTQHTPFGQPRIGAKIKISEAPKCGWITQKLHAVEGDELSIKINYEFAMGHLSGDPSENIHVVPFSKYDYRGEKITVHSEINKLGVFNFNYSRSKVEIKIENKISRYVKRGNRRDYRDRADLPEPAIPADHDVNRRDCRVSLNLDRSIFLLIDEFRKSSNLKKAHIFNKAAKRYLLNWSDKLPDMPESLDIPQYGQVRMDPDIIDMVDVVLAHVRDEDGNKIARMGWLSEAVVAFIREESQQPSLITPSIVNE